MNAESSRSHAIFTITINQRVSQRPNDGTDGNNDPVETTVVSKLTFVDLAGSERYGMAGHAAVRVT